MPTYCYEDQHGQVIEKVFGVGMAPKEIKSGNSKYRRSYAAEGSKCPPPGAGPITCTASGVQATQAGELHSFLKDAGVPTEVTPDGNPVYRDPDHRRKALKARGMFDKDSYR